MENGQTGQQSIAEIAGKVPAVRRFVKPVTADAVAMFFLALILLAGGVGLADLHFTHNFGVAIDDGWIHLTFARNLAQHHSWSINPTGSTGGSTSILWVVLLAGGYLVSDNGPTISMVLNGVFLILVGLLVRRLWSEWNSLSEKTPSAALLPTLLTLACGNLIWYAFTGMETLLVLVLGMSAIYFSARKRDNLAALLVFLSALTRPEGFLVAVAIVLIRRQRGLILKVIFAAGLGLLVTGLWNLYLTGTVLPSTLAGRRWIIGAGEYVSLNPLIVLKNFVWLIGVWAYRLAQFTFGERLLASLGLPMVLSWGIAMSSLLIAAIGFVDFIRRQRSKMITGLLIWTLLQLLAYAVILPTRGHGGRYQPMVPLLAMIFFVLGLKWLWQVFATIKPLRLVPIVTAVLAIFSLFTWFHILAGSLENFDRVHIPAAKWIEKNTPPHARVAALDIGALAYFSHRPVVDLGGLIDPKAGRALYEKRIPQYLESEHADYLLMVYPYTDPNVYFTDFGLDRLRKEGILKWRATFENKIEDHEHHWPGQAARVLASEIRIFEISPKAE
jgi:hypothetical protein